MPAMTGTRAPSIEIGEMTPRSGRPKWRLQSLPPEGEVARAMYCVMTSRGRVAHDEDDAEVADERPDDVALVAARRRVPTEVASWPSER